MHGTDTPERILVLTPSVRGADGVSAVARQVLRALDVPTSRGPGRLEVWSLHDEAERNETNGACASTQRRAGGSKLRFASWGLRSAVRNATRTLVIVLHVGLAPVAWPLVVRGAHLAVFLHGIEAWRRLGRLKAAVVRRAALLMANSQHTAEGFKAANPKFADREIHVCHLGTPALASEACQRLGQEVPTPRSPGEFALIVGRMAAGERYKGHDLLLDLWPRITAEVPGATLLVAGDGDDRARLEARSVALGLQDRVKFLGRVPDETLAQLYRDCAFFVMPSCQEGFGLVFLEAMQAGKACIGAVGAAAEVIEDGVTGLLVDPNQPEQLLNVVLRLFREPQTRSRMGQAGANRVARQFTERHFHERFRTVLGLPDSASVYVPRSPAPNVNSTR